MVHPIYLYGEEVLRKKAELVDLQDPTLPDLIFDMFQTMRFAYGAGLAAPQIGVSKQVIVVEEQLADEELFKGIFINPKILGIFGAVWEMDEGCLSFPGIQGNIRRVTVIDIEWYDEKSEYHRELLNGMKARILQHEIDHLDGTLIVDRMNFVEKSKQFMILENIKNKKVSINYLYK